MKCTYCGEETGDRRDYCPYCGEELTTAPLNEDTAEGTDPTTPPDTGHNYPGSRNDPIPAFPAESLPAQRRRVPVLPMAAIVVLVIGLAVFLGSDSRKKGEEKEAVTAETISAETTGVSAEEEDYIVAAPETEMGEAGTEDAGTVGSRGETWAETTAETPESRKDRAMNAYQKIIDEYKNACGENSNRWLADPGPYLSKYPDVDAAVMMDYHTGNHYDELLDSDEPYELLCRYHDMDSNGIPELILGIGYHELVCFDICVFDGTGARPLRLLESKPFGLLGLYSDGTIHIFDVLDYKKEYYRLASDGYTLERQELSGAQIDDLLKLEPLGFQAEYDSEWILLGSDIPA